MKKLIIGSICLLFFLGSFGQKQGLDFQSTITNYLVGLTKSDKMDSTQFFVLALQVGEDQMINKLLVYYFKDGSIRYLENNTLLARFRADNLVQYSEEGCLSNKDDRNLILPFVLKRVKIVLSPQQETVFNALEFENMIHLLRHAQKDKGVLSKPIVVFMEEPTY